MFNHLTPNIQPRLAVALLWTVARLHLCLGIPLELSKELVQAWPTKRLGHGWRLSIHNLAIIAEARLCCVLQKIYVLSAELRN